MFGLISAIFMSTAAIAFVVLGRRLKHNMEKKGTRGSH